MKVVIAGGSGFLGRALAARLVGTGHDVLVLTRTLPRSAATTAGRPVAWNPDGTAGAWARELVGADAVVNLAGAGIADKRWTTARKIELRTSRLLTTRSLVAAIREAATRPSVFVHNVGVGYYGADLSDREVDESFPPGDDFLSDLCVAWEAEAHAVSALDCRLVIIRSGIVLAADGGALKKMRLPFRLFAGGPIASGRQYFSWIHRADWIALVLWAIARPEVTGVLNGTAPEPVTNAAFSKALGRALGRPSWFPVPGFALRILVGELATAGLILGQRVVPKRPLALGFEFKYPDVTSAVTAAVGRG